jgi:hypothetical protein
MKRTFLIAVPVVFLLFSFSRGQTPAERGKDEPQLSGIKFTRVPTVSDSGGPLRPDEEMNVEVYNEGVAELEDRVQAYRNGTETESGLLDVLERTLPLVLAVNHPDRPRGKLRLQLLSTLAMQAEEIRKVMATRARNKKLSAPRASADLHRARRLCVQVNYELWRSQLAAQPPQIVPLQPVPNPPAPLPVP